MTYRCYDSDLATDIVQEAFVRVWEKQLEFQGEKTKNLLYKIINELWISHYRKKKTENKYSLALNLETCKNSMEKCYAHVLLAEKC